MRVVATALAIVFLMVGCATTIPQDAQVHKPSPGEWVEVVRSENGGYFIYITCCDCGLIHLFQIKAEDDKIYLRAWRDNRKTDMKRKTTVFPCQCGTQLYIPDWRKDGFQR